MKKRLYTNVEKEFKSKYGFLTICRLDYIGLDVPMIAEEMSDEQMQKIVDEINLSMAQDYDKKQLNLLWKYKNENCKDLTEEEIRFADKMSEKEFEYFENCAIKFGMRYWEDLDEDEQKELSKKIQEKS